jgi:hypothetical protein
MSESEIMERLKELNINTTAYELNIPEATIAPQLEEHT